MVLYRGVLLVLVIIFWACITCGYTKVLNSFLPYLQRISILKCWPNLCAMWQYMHGIHLQYMCQYTIENKQIRKTLERKTCISNMGSQPNPSGQGSEVNADPTPPPTVLYSQILASFQRTSLATFWSMWTTTTCFRSSPLGVLTTDTEKVFAIF